MTKIIKNITGQQTLRPYRIHEYSHSLWVTYIIEAKGDYRWSEIGECDTLEEAIKEVKKFDLASYLELLECKAE